MRDVAGELAVVSGLRGLRLQDRENITSRASVELSHIKSGHRCYQDSIRRAGPLRMRVSEALALADAPIYSAAQPPHPNSNSPLIFTAGAKALSRWYGEAA
jgi:hypothetical protein